LAIEFSFGWTMTLNIIGWPLIQLGLAWVFIRFPDRWFNPPRQRAWEMDGRFYERWFNIRRWKDRLPDAASWFGGGFPKARLAATAPGYLERFIRETRRGEICHATAFLFLPMFYLWNPGWADAVMTVYAIVANLPCILAQRYNRIRLRRLLERTLPAMACQPAAAPPR
jgi:glycosyl-4,4'-diaponeurosporenoate acyltransferase